MLGKGVTRYIVLPTTSGGASCPETMPVENVHATPSCRTFSVLISVRPEKRVAAYVFAGITHCPSSCCSAAGSVDVNSPASGREEPGAELSPAGFWQPPMAAATADARKMKTTLGQRRVITAGLMQKVHLRLSDSSVKSAGNRDDCRG